MREGFPLNFIMRLARLDFLPRSTDCALLLLCVWLGLSLLLLHGKGKLMSFSEMSSKFADPLGVGTTTSLALTVFAEFVCAALLVVGLFTRFAAAVLAFTMGVAFVAAHKGVLSGPGNGELAFIYLSGFVAIFVAGGGRFAIDARLRRPAGSSPTL